MFVGRPYARKRRGDVCDTCARESTRVYSCKYEREGALMGVLMGCILTGGRGRVSKR